MKTTILRSRMARVAVLLAALGLAACGPAPVSQGISDPHETRNRDIHEVNVALDKFFLRPVSQGVDAVAPDPVIEGVSNFADNLDMPKSFVNNVLQGRIDKAAENAVRFALNSTIGVLGLFDPATAMGVPQDETDFGETLHVWGVPEGNYGELPILGPTTDRDALGSLVDLALNPLRFIVPAEYALVPTGAKVVATIGDRGRYSATYDSILYDSSDSYAQARLMYLQNRRYELAGGASSGAAVDDDSFIDPYEDPYAE